MKIGAIIIETSNWAANTANQSVCIHDIYTIYGTHLLHAIHLYIHIEKKNTATKYIMWIQ